MEWFDALKLSVLPAGFSRFATDHEAALIAGRTTPAEFAPPRSKAAPSAGAGAKRARRPPSRNRLAVGQRFRDLLTFVRTVHADLTPTQRAIWLAVFAFSENGRAIVTQATLAKIAGVSVRAVQKAIPGLTAKGLLGVLERGKPGRSSVYCYRLG